MNLKYDRAKATQVLEFWQKIEFFVPFDLSQVENNSNEKYWIDEYGSNNLVWLAPRSLDQPKSYNLYLGIFDARDINRICNESGLADTDEMRRIENLERGAQQTCFARFRIDKDQKVDLEKFSVSTLPWALGRLAAGKLDDLTADNFASAKQSLQLEIHDFFSGLKQASSQGKEEEQTDGLARPLSGADVVRLAELLFNWAGFWPEKKRLGLVEVYLLKRSKEREKSSQVEPSPRVDESEEKLTAFLKDQGTELVAVFDGLDRLTKPEQFWSVAEQDLRAIRPLEVSVLATGPLSIMYGQGRQIKDYFDEVHYLPPAVADPRVSPFLLEILLVRGAGELMQPEQMQKLCLASGGILRDLISLARSAGENAYLEDADDIEVRHVDRAIEQLGNSYLLGLGTRQKAILENVLQGKGFTPSDAQSMELLITRRVLEQSESAYEVHPALVTVLSQTQNRSE